MFKNISKILLGASIFTLFFSTISYAGTWEIAGSDWRYQNDDGSYATNTWVFIDGFNYCFDSNGLMLKDTLSPDSYPLGREGKRLTTEETLPSTFSGDEASFNAYFASVMSYLDGYDRSFNTAYDAHATSVYHVQSTQDFDDAKKSVEIINSFDFTPYMNSDNAFIRKFATNSDIFRIEQVYYLTELITTGEHLNLDEYNTILDKISVSVDKYADNTNSILSLLSTWDVY